ncbi:MAG: lamin tail domain-containing protein [Flavobacteriales bacterium]|nr:lamin tail domain-containing protein [Flavobacteriales bacterium]
MALRTLLLLLCWIPTLGFAQFVDDFTDGEFSSNPAWLGDTTLFQVNAQGQLQSTGPAASDTAHLYTAFSPNFNDTITWTWYWRLDFAPSNNNQGRVFLLASDTSLINGEGYFIRLGRNGSDDALELFSFSGGNEVQLINGLTVLSSSSERWVTVHRYPDGLWKVESAAENGSPFVLEGSAIDSTIINTNYFGVWCKYTSSNSSDFYFDNMEVDSVVTDTTPPSLISVEPLDATHLSLVFNEALDPTTAVLTTNYSLDNGIGQALAASIDLEDSLTVELVFTDSFPIGTTLNLSIENVTDAIGNSIEPNIQSFTYYAWLVPSHLDIVINEIMADPTPVVGLPEREYIELLNVSGRFIRLDSFTLSDATSTTAIPHGVRLPPDSFLILCDVQDTSLFNAFGTAIGLASFPSLNNDGDDVVLRRSSHLIDATSFTKAWYQDETAQDGGYALERVNPFHPCSGPLNWKASLSPDGGTPGKQNAGLDTSPDLTPPRITHLTAEDSGQILLGFSEALDTLSISSGSFELVSHTLTVKEKQLERLVIKSFPPLEEGVPYVLSIAGLMDCQGNEMEDTTILFGIPVLPQPFDLVINELLPHPEASGPLPNAEYVEIYNRSNKLISTAQLQLADKSTVASIPEVILAPDGYAIICDDDDALLFQGNVLAVSSMPSLNNDADDLRLMMHHTTIDVVGYAKSWYQDPEKQAGGWSLERIDPNDLCRSDSNWKASNHPSHGTPGEVNSVFSELTLAPIEITSLLFIRQDQVEVTFDRKVDSTSVFESTLNGSSVALRFDNGAQRANLTLGSDMQKGTVYTLRISSISACDGQSYSGLIDSTYLADTGDVVLNELLFEARNNGTEFIELANTTTSSIPLLGWSLAQRDDDELRAFPLVNYPFELGPNALIAFHEDLDDLVLNYPFAGNETLHITQLPALPNDEGTCFLINPFGEVMDSLHYSRDMHFALIQETAGVSLERLSTFQPASDPGNWHSASSIDHYGTPGYINSQALPLTEGDAHVQLSNARISPDNDGYEDVLSIEWRSLPPGQSISIRVFSQEGRLIRTVASNRLIGKEGLITWDGTNDIGRKAEVGIYAVLVETFDLQANTQRYRLPFVVAAKL